MNFFIFFSPIFIIWVLFGGTGSSKKSNSVSNSDGSFFSILILLPLLALLLTAIAFILPFILIGLLMALAIMAMVGIVYFLLRHWKLATKFIKKLIGLLWKFAKSLLKIAIKALKLLSKNVAKTLRFLWKIAANTLKYLSKFIAKIFKYLSKISSRLFKYMPHFIQSLVHSAFHSLYAIMKNMLIGTMLFVRAVWRRMKVIIFLLSGLILFRRQKNSTEKRVHTHVTHDTHAHKNTLLQMFDRLLLSFIQLFQSWFYMLFARRQRKEHSPQITHPTNSMIKIGLGTRLASTPFLKHIARR